MEILAPAGNRESLERAYAAGADAVYLGYSAFSARAGAGNFNREELEDAIRFAHLRHMRVYVTVNTLIKDGELEEVFDVLRLLAGLKADGVLVQDAGVLRLARKYFPGLPVHASTQMAIHNATGVRWCADMGMKRAVLARECSLEEIRSCAEAGAEAEVFAHGAQCVAVSGLCLFSSMVGERSGNRGRCAQPCRQNYRYNGVEGAWLSPRDVCLRDELPALKRAGVASLKIEGRLKRPEYVAVVTDSYRRAEDALESGCFLPAKETEKEALRQIFNRGGFMKGYAMGCEDAGVILPESVNHQGIEIGRVEAAAGGMARVRVKKELHNGDGIRFRSAGHEADMTYSGRDTEKGGIAVVRLREGIRVREGDAVFRLTDAAQLAAAQAMQAKRIPVEMELFARPGKPMELTVTDGECTVCAAGNAPEKAINRETTPEELEKSLRKTGGTVFEAEKIRIETGGAFVQASAVNALRREALDGLGMRRISAFEKAGKESPAAGFERSCLPEKLLPLTVKVRTAEQADAVRGDGVRVLFSPEDYRPEALKTLLKSMRKGDWLCLPEVCEENTLEMLWRLTGEYADFLGGAVLGSIGQLGRKWPVPVAAGSGIPVMNREAAALLFEQGCEFVTASPELTGKELETLLRGCPGIVVSVYGRTQLMLLHHCPARTLLGLEKGHAGCDMCSDPEEKRALRGHCLEDRRGYRYPLLRLRLPEGCLVRLMNAAPTDLTDKKAPENRLLELTDEGTEEAAELLMCARTRRRAGRAEGNTTRGHWNRPVD